MRSFLKFVAVFITILLVSAILAPVLYDYLPFKFEKIFNRLVMIGVILAVILFVRIRKETFVRFGMDWKKESLRFFMTGFLTGFFVLVLIAVLGLLTGHARWAYHYLDAWEWTEKLALCLGSALLIGALEEFFFRGFIFTNIRDRFRWSVLASMIATSVFYSSLHFVSAKKPFVGPDPVFWDSLRLMAAPLKSFLNFPDFWPSALGLFLFGMILNDTAVRTKSLYPAIGLHSGCVLFIKLDGIFLHALDKDIFFWGSKKVYDGVIGWVFLIVIWILLRKILKAQPDQTSKAASLTEGV